GEAALEPAARARVEQAHAAARRLARVEDGDQAVLRPTAAGGEGRPDPEARLDVRDQTARPATEFAGAPGSAGTYSRQGIALAGPCPARRRCVPDAIRSRTSCGSSAGVAPSGTTSSGGPSDVSIAAELELRATARATCACRPPTACSAPAAAR